VDRRCSGMLYARVLRGAWVCMCMWSHTHTHTHTHTHKWTDGVLACYMRNCSEVRMYVCMRTHTSRQTVFWHATYASPQRCVCVCVYDNTHKWTDSVLACYMHDCSEVCVRMCMCVNTHELTDGVLACKHARVLRGVCAYVKTFTIWQVTSWHANMRDCLEVRACMWKHSWFDRWRPGMQTCASAQRCVCVCENIHDLTGDVLACKHARLLRGACVDIWVCTIVWVWGCVSKDFELGECMDLCSVDCS